MDFLTTDFGPFESIDHALDDDVIRMAGSDDNGLRHGFGSRQTYFLALTFTAALRARSTPFRNNTHDGV